MTDRSQTLAVLSWLLEAGADEAIAEQPVNRFRASAPPAPQRNEAAAPREAPGIRAAPPSALRGPSSPLPPKPANLTAEAVSLSTPAGAARALAAGCTTLEELRQALINFDGCGDLKRSAKNTVFADG